ncbi:MAG: hypothetical protein ACPL3B_06230 [Fervidobacterium sp.]
MRKEIRGFPSIRELIWAKILEGVSREEIKKILVEEGYDRKTAAILVEVYLSRIRRKFK